MRLLLALLVIFIMIGIIEYQIVGQNATRRRDSCKTVIMDNGVYREATPYEFYSCLGK